jgi:hypothetical protein
LIISFPFIGQIAKKIRIFPLIVLLLCPISLWILTEAIARSAVPEAISLQIVRAYTARIDLKINRIEDESSESILRTAEAISQASAQLSFDKDILGTNVSVILTAESYGEIPPVLALEVSSQQWGTRRPNLGNLLQNGANPAVVGQANGNFPYWLTFPYNLLKLAG